MANASILTTKDWIWLLVVIAGASVANMGALHQISSGLADDMRELDLRWQARTADLAKGISEDLKDIQKQIPPDWFRDMVDKNSLSLDEHERRIDELEKKFVALEARP